MVIGDIRLSESDKPKSVQTMATPCLLDIVHEVLKGSQLQLSNARPTNLRVDRLDIRTPFEHFDKSPETGEIEITRLLRVCRLRGWS